MAVNKNENIYLDDIHFTSYTMPIVIRSKIFLVKHILEILCDQGRNPAELDRMIRGISDNDSIDVLRSMIHCDLIRTDDHDIVITVLGKQYITFLQKRDKSCKNRLKRITIVSRREPPGMPTYPVASKKRRLSRLGGFKRMGGLIFEENKGIVTIFLEDSDSLEKIATPMDVVKELTKRRTFFGCGG